MDNSISNLEKKTKGMVANMFNHTNWISNEEYKRLKSNKKRYNNINGLISIKEMDVNTKIIEEK